MRYRGFDVEIVPKKPLSAKIRLDREPALFGGAPLGRIVVSFDCNRDLEVALCGACSHNGPESLGYSALLSDNTSHIIGSNGKVENDNAFRIGLVLDDLYSRLVLNETCRDRIQ